MGENIGYKYVIFFWDAKGYIELKLYDEVTYMSLALKACA
jgi:hypothetical protein